VWWDMSFLASVIISGDYQVAKWVNVCGGLYGGRTLHISGQWEGFQNGFIDGSTATSSVGVYLDAYGDTSRVVGGGGYVSVNSSPLATPDNQQPGPFWGTPWAGPPLALAWDDILLPAGQHRLLVVCHIAAHNVQVSQFIGGLRFTVT
jgi:hypothetical protein